MDTEQLYIKDDDFTEDFKCIVEFVALPYGNFYIMILINPLLHAFFSSSVFEI